MFDIEPPPPAKASNTAVTYASVVAGEFVIFLFVRVLKIYDITCNFVVIVGDRFVVSHFVTFIVKSNVYRSYSITCNNFYNAGKFVMLTDYNE